MKMKIVADSSANLLALPDIDFGVVPLHIIVGENDYIDDDKIDLTAMQENLSSYKGKTSTSSPSPHEWENAFGDADVVFCITVTSSLSGTYNSAVIAKDIYEQNHAGRKVYVLDSLSTGPEIALFIEKIAELIKAGFAPDDIYKTLLEYKDKTHLYFSLASLNNFAKKKLLDKDSLPVYICKAIVSPCSSSTKERMKYLNTLHDKNIINDAAFNSVVTKLMGPAAK